MSPIIILLIIVGVVLLYVVYLYNSLIQTKTRTQNAQRDIDIQLKRRYELVPNLIETVKGVAKQEKELFAQVSEARSGLVKGNLNDKVQANNQLSDTLKSLFAVAEAYPEMKSNKAFENLQAELTDTQDKIMASERFYQSMVQKFDEQVQSFPTNIFAKMLGFNEKDFEYIEIEDKARENVKVDFS